MTRIYVAIAIALLVDVSVTFGNTYESLRMNFIESVSASGLTLLLTEDGGLVATHSGDNHFRRIGREIGRFEHVVRTANSIYAVSSDSTIWLVNADFTLNKVVVNSASIPVKTFVNSTSHSSLEAVSGDGKRYRLVDRDWESVDSAFAFVELKECNGVYAGLVDNTIYIKKEGSSWKNVVSSVIDYEMNSGKTIALINVGTDRMLVQIDTNGNVVETMNINSFSHCVSVVGSYAFVWNLNGFVEVIDLLRRHVAIQTLDVRLPPINIIARSSCVIDSNTFIFIGNNNAIVKCTAMGTAPEVVSFLSDFGTSFGATASYSDSVLCVASGYSTFFVSSDTGLTWKPVRTDSSHIQNRVAQKIVTLDDNGSGFALYSDLSMDAFSGYGSNRTPYGKSITNFAVNGELIVQLGGRRLQTLTHGGVVLLDTVLNTEGLITKTIEFLNDSTVLIGASIDTDTIRCGSLIGDAVALELNVMSGEFRVIDIPGSRCGTSVKVADKLIMTYLYDADSCEMGSAIVEVDQELGYRDLASGIEYGLLMAADSFDSTVFLSGTRGLFCFNPSRESTTHTVWKSEGAKQVTFHSISALDRDRVLAAGTDRIGRAELVLFSARSSTTDMPDNQGSIQSASPLWLNDPYPVPASSYVNYAVDWDLSVSSNATATLYNCFGDVVVKEFTLSQPVVNPSHHVLDLTGLVSGAYYLVIKRNGFSACRSILKL